MSVTQLPERVAAGRLEIRSWRQQDGPAMEHLIRTSLDHLRPWMAWARAEPIPIEQRTRMFIRWERYRKSGDGAIYAVFHHADLIGGCALHRRVGPRGLDIGYWLGVNAIRRGHATAITSALVDLASSRNDIDFVRISHEAANSASAAVAERLGFASIATSGDVNTKTWHLDTSDVRGESRSW